MSRAPPQSSSGPDGENYIRMASGEVHQESH
uniref:Uncharacterized protein n=1 Tax=Timema cristinae TaxID=61476 RepID=A0A7R9DIV6_TIMCR|nr:unnamed protein product [Timema cristinae]